MNRPLLMALLALALSTGVAISTLGACSSSTSSPACNALANCCLSPDVDDPSSCTETAMSGYLTNVECQQKLEAYVENGTCLADGGLGDSGGGSDAK